MTIQTPRTLFSAALLIVVTSISFAEEGIKAEIDSANAKFGEIFGGDPLALAALYTIDGQLLLSGQEALQGRDAIAAFWKGAYESGLNGVELTALEVTSLGDHAAEVGRYKLLTAAGDIADHGKYVVLWKRVNGTWQLHRDIITSSVKPK